MRGQLVGQGQQHPHAQGAWGHLLLLALARLLLLLVVGLAALLHAVAPWPEQLIGCGDPERVWHLQLGLPVHTGQQPLLPAGVVAGLLLELPAGPVVAG